MLTIRLYTKPACQQCEATKKWLKQKGFDFDNPPPGVDMIIEDATEPMNTEAIKFMGYSSAPVLFVEDGAFKDHWSGFRPDKIDSLAERYNQGD